MRLEDLRVGEWYVVATPQTPLCGAPVQILSVSPPFVLAKDYADDMVVLDMRVQSVSAVSPEYVECFQKAWKIQVARKRKEVEEDHKNLCIECGLDVTEERDE